MFTDLVFICEVKVNLIFKTAVGIYIVSVLVFSSFSKATEASTDFILSEDLYNLAVPLNPTNGLIDSVPSEQTQIVSGLVGDIILDGKTLFFVADNENVFFRIPSHSLDEFGIEILPVKVEISGYYYPPQRISSASSQLQPKTLNVGDIRFLN